MNLVILLPVFIGAAAVLQATMNRHIADRWGLAPAVLLNTSIAGLCSLALLAYCSSAGARSGLLRVAFEPASFRWWWPVPGLFGFAIVVGLPWAVGKAGALPTFVALVAAQTVTSALWDRFALGIAFDFTRALGSLLAIASVWLVGRP
ncbi:MAG TPA: DMT family transporter [Polyangiales bacterium]|nr:DMT family transporter [Polyangiales bacterium]